MVLSSSELVNKINKILNGYDDDYDIHETNAFSSLNLMEFAINKLNNKEDFKLTFLVKEKTLNMFREALKRAGAYVPENI